MDIITHEDIVAQIIKKNMEIIKRDVPCYENKHFSLIVYNFIFSQI